MSKRFLDPEHSTSNANVRQVQEDSVNPPTASQANPAESAADPATIASPKAELESSPSGPRSKIKIQKSKATNEPDPLHLDSLPGLGVTITTHHNELRQRRLFACVDIGRKLLQVKATVKHGEYLPWVNVNCPFGTSQASRYTQIARYFMEFINLAGTRHLSPNALATLPDSELTQLVEEAIPQLRSNDGEDAATMGQEQLIKQLQARIRLLDNKTTGDREVRSNSAHAEAKSNDSTISKTHAPPSRPAIEQALADALTFRDGTPEKQAAEQLLDLIETNALRLASKLPSETLRLRRVPHDDTAHRLLCYVSGELNAKYNVQDRR